LERVVNEHLPKNWGQVSFSYERLRGASPELQTFLLAS
jgi:hypothetical protein